MSRLVRTSDASSVSIKILVVAEVEARSMGAGHWPRADWWQTVGTGYALFAVIKSTYAMKSAHVASSRLALRRACRASREV